MLIYGRKLNNPSPLLSSEIGEVKVVTIQQKENFDLFELGRWLLLGAEVALSFIPGIGLLGETALAATFAAGNIGLDLAQTGKINPVNAGISIASTLLPGIGQGIKNIRQGFKATKTISRELESLKSAFDAGRAVEADVTKIFRNQQILEGVDLKGLKNPFTNTQKQLSEGFAKGLEQAGKDFTPFKNIDKLSKDFTKASIGKQAIKLGDDVGETVDDLKKKFVDGTALADRKVLEQFFDIMLKQSIRSDRAIQSAWNNLLRLVSPRTAKRLLTNLKRMGETQSFVKFVRGTFGTRWNNIVKKIGSRGFNDRFVQRVQLIDPNDAGRALVERAYQGIKKWIDDKWHKFKKWIRKTFKMEQRLEDALSKNGWTVLNSRYLQAIKPMYKIHDSKIPGKDTWEVQVRFNKTNTMSSKGKNKGGKKPIIVRMTSLDMEKLATQGSSYWFEVGHKKGWWVTKGGRAMSGSFQSITNKLSLFLGFIPISALRNIISITSNLVENVASWANSKGAGGFISDWFKKAGHSFTNSVTSRAGRLVGGVLAKKALGEIPGIGKVAHRYFGSISQKFVSAGIHSVRDGNSFKSEMRNIGKTTASSFSRRNRKHGAMGVRTQAHGIERNFKISRSVGSAVTVGRINMPKIKI